MGIITISVSEPVEKEFRRTVTNKLGKGKGVLGKAVGEAMRQWVHTQKQHEIAQEMIALMDRGFVMGKILIKSRDELYDR